VPAKFNLPGIMEYWKNGIMFSAIQYKPKIPIFQYSIIPSFFALGGWMKLTWIRILAF
jgi:hypothetical protein